MVWGEVKAGSPFILAQAMLECMVTKPCVMSVTENSGSKYMPWAKGQSGNPGGRPSGTLEFRALAQKHSKMALKTLVHECQYGEPATVRVLAANSLLDRAYGRPAQMFGEGEDGSLVIRIIKPDEELVIEHQPAPLKIVNGD